jgi:hypothetical protein
VTSRLTVGASFGLALLVGYQTASAEKGLNVDLGSARITITERRVLDPTQEKYFPCSEFVRTADEARAFLLNSKVISSQERHYEFDQYHCEVIGTAMTKTGVLQFTIRLGGTGSVTYPNGMQLLLGCREQCCKVVGNICG